MITKTMNTQELQLLRHLTSPKTTLSRSIQDHMAITNLDSLSSDIFFTDKNKYVILNLNSYIMRIGHNHIIH